jgi:hypothetical protein
MATEEKTGVPGPRDGDDVVGRPTVVLPRARPPRPPGSPKGPTDRRKPPLAAVASINALWGALVSFLPMLGVVAAITLAAPHPPPVWPTVRFGIGGWLLAHGVPLRVDGVPIALAPLAVTALAAWRCGRAGRNTMRAVGSRGAASAGPALAVSATIGLAYGVIGAVLALVASGPNLAVSPVRAALALGGFGFACAFVGATRGTKFAARLRTRMPAVLRDALRTGVIAVLLLLACGAAAVGASLAVHGGTGASMFANLHLDATQQAGVMLACLAFAPNVSVWAASFLSGPGFSLVAVPQLPIFAAAPQHAATGPAQFLLATPLVAGACAGYLLARRRKRLAAEAAALRDLRPGGAARGPDAGIGTSGVGGSANGAPGAAVPPAPGLALIGAAMLGGVVSTALLAVAGYVAAGALGRGPMASTGQVGLEFALIAGGGIVLGAAVGAGLGLVRRRRV